MRQRDVSFSLVWVSYFSPYEKNTKHKKIYSHAFMHIHQDVLSHISLHDNVNLKTLIKLTVLELIYELQGVLSAFNQITNKSESNIACLSRHL